MLRVCMSKGCFLPLNEAGMKGVSLETSLRRSLLTNRQFRFASRVAGGDARNAIAAETDEPHPCRGFRPPRVQDDSGGGGPISTLFFCSKIDLCCIYE